MLKLNNLCKSFDDNTILNNIDFSIEEHEFVTLFGPNGCGKSTLMNILTGVEKPTDGDIIGHTDLKGQIGYVFQDYRRTLLPWYTAKQNILLPLILRKVPKIEQQKRLQELVDYLKPSFDLNQRVFTLSGGQAQLIGLMRALIIQPRLLILDEPFSALDYERTLQLRQIVMDVALHWKLTVLFISHDLEEALYLGDRVVFFTQRPTRISSILPVTFPRPRYADLLGSAEFAALKLEALRRINVLQS